MPDLVLGSTTILSDSSGTPTIQSGVDLGLTANHSGVKTALNATGDAPIYACRAWVNFNGTGTVAIRDSGNVSSITDNGAGKYTVNFTTAMPDANYATVCSAGSTTTTYPRLVAGGSNGNSTYTSSAVGLSVIYTNDQSSSDQNRIQVAVFR